MEQGPLAEAEHLVAMRPDDTEARLALAGLYAEAGRPSDAAAQYRLLLRMDAALLPALVEPIEHLANAYGDDPHAGRLLGDLYMRQGRYNQAMAVYRTLLAASVPA